MFATPAIYKKHKSGMALQEYLRWVNNVGNGSSFTTEQREAMDENVE